MELEVRKKKHDSNTEKTEAKSDGETPWVLQALKWQILEE